MPQPRNDEYQVDEVVADVARLRIATVNVYFLGLPRKVNVTGAANPVWVLVDAGLAHGAAEILRIAAERFGLESRPAAIVLTHGHFDHVGALPALLAVWDVPVYAHMAELPFLTGHADFPPPDATVGSGMPARLAPQVPEAGLDLGDRIHALPANGRIPSMPHGDGFIRPVIRPATFRFFARPIACSLPGTPSSRRIRRPSIRALCSVGSCPARRRISQSTGTRPNGPRRSSPR